MKTMAKRPRARVRTRARLEFPREHGFWTMLAATQIVSIAKVGSSLASWGASLGVVLLFGIGAGLVGSSVRKTPSLQVLMSVALGGSGIAVELFGGGSLASALWTALAWCAVFASSALLVRSAFLRRKVEAGRVPQYKLVLLETGGLAVCALSAAAFAALGLGSHALALVLATVALGALGALEPGPKQVKPLGLSLAALMLVVSVVLVFGESLGARLMG